MKKFSVLIVVLLVVIGGYFAVTTSNFGFGQGFLGQELNETSFDEEIGIGYRVYYFGNDGNRSGSDVFVERDSGKVNFSIPAETFRVEIQSNFVTSDDLATFDKEKSHMSANFRGLFKKKCSQDGEFNTVGKLVVLCDIEEKDLEMVVNAKWGNKRIMNELIFKIVE